MICYTLDYMNEFYIFRKGKNKVCGKIAAYPKDICHPDHYQCIGKCSCRQARGPQFPNKGNSRGNGHPLRPCKGLEGKKLKECRRRVSRKGNRQSNRSRSISAIQPCLKVARFPRKLKTCRKRFGIIRRKRDILKQDMATSAFKVKRIRILLVI